MKALSLALSAFALMTSAVEARSLMPIRPIIQLTTDDAKGEDAQRPTNFRNFPTMTLTLKNDGMLEIVSEKFGKKTVEISHENFLHLQSQVIYLSAAKIKEERFMAVCMMMPSDARDTMSIATNMRDVRSFPGALRSVWAQGGCNWGHHIGFVEDYHQKMAEQIVFVLRTIALEALK